MPSKRAGKDIAIDVDAIAVVRTSIERILRQAGKTARRPFKQASDFPAYWHEVSTLYGDDDLAIRVALELPVGGFGRTSYAFASAANLGDAIRVFCRDAQRRVDGMQAILEVRGKVAELRLVGPETIWPIIEILLGVIALRCEQLAEPAVPIKHVELPRSAPRDLQLWQRVFGVKPRFGFEHGLLVVQADQLKRPLRTADPVVREALGSGPLTSFAEQVRTHVRAWVRESPAADEVARALGVSVRTLQRRLGEEGVNFRELVLDTKIEVAKQLLERGQLSIGEVASAVGFSGAPAFSNAFSQRTGVAPTRFRSRH